MASACVESSARRRASRSSCSPLGTSERDTVQLLNAGADDYITKPFSTPELVARVQAQLRRSQLYQAHAATQCRFALGDLTIDLAPPHCATRDGHELGLTPVEWHLLRVLATNAGRTLTHQQLFHAVWGNVFGDAQQNLRVHITHLRRKIEKTPTLPSIIVTEPGVGYRCEPGAETELARAVDRQERRARTG